MDATIHYVTIGLVDFEARPGPLLRYELEEAMGDAGIAHVIDIETQILEEWEDSNPLNFSDKSSEEFKRLFNK